ncbi:small membrane A-kinase anchor protein [Thamnophis elegans]|uniref:small membrane A-kinase anchor protein n=1 Tax=Thamnophis elegans TaxID=35005 RepID=UPI00137694BC|nr:small membrane A-kinase anchor protein [Thamnophis elegans]
MRPFYVAKRAGVGAAATASRRILGELHTLISACKKATYPSKGQYIKADCAAKLNSSRTMGCIKSKSPFPHTILDDGSREVGKFDSGCNLEKSSLIQANSEMPSPTNTAVLDFAHRLSLEILDQAVKQWAINESKYSDIPFIESDEP